MSIINVLTQIKNNVIVLPAIQRNFVWHEDQIKKLMDSILRGYPVGIALMWETYHSLQYREFVRDHRENSRAIFRESSAGQRLKVVLDGQQRLQSLYVAIFGTFDGKHLCFNILSGIERDDTSEPKYIFDFSDSNELQSWNEYSRTQMLIDVDKRANEFTPYFGVKASDLFSMSSKSREQLAAKLIHDLNLAQEEQSRMRVNLATFDQMLTKDENVLKLSVIDENLPHNSEERKTEMDVLEIFVRVNSGGTHLNRSDLIFSMLKLSWKESAEELPDFVDRINRGNSFGITTDFVIRCLLVVSDLGSTFELNLLRKKSNIEILRANFAECCKSIEATIDFVSTHCWVHTSRLIGGHQILVPLVYYFFRLDRHRVPNSEIGHLRFGFFLLAFSGALSRYSESRINKLVGAELKPLADTANNVFPVNKISGWIHHWGEPNEIGTELIRRNHQLALNLIQGFAGSDVKYSDNLPEVDHIFPAATLRARGLDESRVNHFANFWILARGKNRNKSHKAPSLYFEDVPDTEMHRALIDRELLDFDRYDDFIIKRSLQITTAVRQKIEGSTS